MAEKKEDKKKTKRPTAVKRDYQNAERALRNQMAKSKTRTALRSLDTALQKKEPAQVKLALQNVYSALDKGVKTGLFKSNKANRLKARAATKAAKA